MRENMTFLTNYYQIREMTIDRMKEIIDQNKNAKGRRYCLFWRFYHPIYGYRKIFSGNR